MDSTFEGEVSEGEPEPPTRENESESGNATLKGALLQTITSLLFSLGIIVLRTG